MSKFDGTVKSDFDQEIESKLEALFQDFMLSPLDVLKHFPVFSRRQALKRFLAHAELFRMSMDLPGDIVELGVFRGLGLLTWANLLEAYCMGNRTKTVYGFDNWRGFEAIVDEDGPTDERMHKIVGGYSPADHRRALERAIEIFDSDRFIPQKPRIKLIDGDISESVPEFVNANPGIRISLVHFDCDVYQPTYAALQALWPRVVRGGIVLFDEYAIKEWPGETRAVDEFMAVHPNLRLKTLKWTNSPAALLTKP